MQVLELGEEFGTVALGDRRRDERCRSLAARIQEHPNASFPAMFTDAELEAHYRFTNNEAVRTTSLLAPHRKASWVRGAASDAHLVIHDTTEFSFEGEAPREGLVFSGKRNSFHGHFSLLIEETEAPVVHGVVGVDFYLCQNHVWSYVDEKNALEPIDNGSHRWWSAVKRVRTSAPHGHTLVHVMDREGDDFTLLANLAASEDDFVIRSLPDRRVVEKEGRICAVLQTRPFVLERLVHLSSRGSRRPPKDLKPHPPRDARSARLSIRAATVTLKKPLNYKEVAPATLTVSVVEVLELEPPEGASPVDWRILSTLPVTTPEEVARVVDIYRKRWLIEEYFKALKTGCAAEERQAESRHAILNTLALLIPTAVRLLQVRAAARHAPDALSDGLLDAVELAALRALVPTVTLDKAPTNRQVSNALARAGGHLRSNGEPGWLVLGRGFQRLLTFSEGWRAALALRT